MMQKAYSGTYSVFQNQKQSATAVCAGCGTVVCLDASVRGWRTACSSWQRLMQEQQQQHLQQQGMQQQQN
jgi:hypothetical protein